jgi:MarR family transcriptional regulator, organic hydroperoxide resistance regulator
MGASRRACEAWKLLLEVMGAARARLPALGDELGLSEAQCQVLQLLDPAEPVAMCRVAEALACDPSNVTGIVDRLEARGLVERRADAADRRVKKLVLTAAGRAQRARLVARVAEPPAAFSGLPAEDQEQLLAILRRAAGAPQRPAAAGTGRRRVKSRTR